MKNIFNTLKRDLGKCTYTIVKNNMKICLIPSYSKVQANIRINPSNLMSKSINFNIGFE